MWVWVTRAQPGADATAARLKAMGRRPLVCPLLVVEPIAGAAPDLEGVAALAFTSANGVRAFAAVHPGRSTPVFAVGDATAREAKAAGFCEITSAAGDVEALAAKLSAAFLDGAVLHPCAEAPAGDLVGALRQAGVEARALPVYRSRPVDALPAPAVAALFEGAVAAVLLHSPRAAGVLARRVGAGAELATAAALGLSPACLEPVAHLPFRTRRSAAAPREDALLALLP